ncbi:unnamed protein product [Didymodactylos carnosus]|uniref:dolichyl-diphosphooligosaccharide--protein glycotransferase n=1 Tax=Didymodactylos carnosus TaxID=1234261 RepID=A0A8S2H692_9BILA|nr:unnamed protein product [Didymodactylos carnosus]CAF3599275.1 unnamed protein product [Didymodactylos carnosus]
MERSQLQTDVTKQVTTITTSVPSVTTKKSSRTKTFSTSQSSANQLLSPTGLASLISFIVLTCAYISGFMSRLFSVIRFESIIHEFDPWFNYRATHYMVENGFYNFLNWFDERAWYPLGRIVGGTVYPGLMVTSGVIHWLLHMINIPIHIREICVFLAPFFSGLTALATYLLTKELWSKSAGLFAAAFIAVAPGYSSRSVAGSYDNEGIAIFALMFTYFLWIKSVKTGSIFWSCSTAISYFYMVSAWGGYVFIINLIPVHAFMLIVLKRYSLRLYVSYSIFFIIGLILSMQIPFVGFQPVRTSEHMLAAGVFALIQAYGFIDYLYTKLPRANDLKQLFFGLILAVGALVFSVVVILTYTGYIAPWSGRFYSLWDTNYAKIHIPIIASVSEHQPTTWASFFFDLHLLICLFPVGAWFCIKELNDERVFIVLYAVFASYFAGVMIRLMLTLTPCVCVLAAIALSKTLDYYADADSNENDTPAVTSADDGNDTSESEEDANNVEITTRQLYDKAGKQKTSSVTTGNRHHRQQLLTATTGATATDTADDTNIIGSNIKTIVVICIAMMLMLLAVHCTWVTSNAYSSPSIVLASYNQDGSRYIIAYYWLRKNTPDRSRVMSWWDYGYQIAGMGNRTTLVDNNTWNNSHIALVGKAMSSNETEAYKIMRMLDVDYVLVIFGGVIGYSGDDINKFLWMVRIAEGEHPKDIREKDYFTENDEFRVDSAGSPILLNCLMYKLCYYRFGELQSDFRTPPGFDRTRHAEIGNKNFDLEHVEEAYTTEHWIVRIYKVKNLKNRLQAKNALRQVLRRKSIYSQKSSKSTQRKTGVILNKPQIKKGQVKAKSIKT